jgi:AraC-like DNA-binding protein
MRPFLRKPPRPGPFFAVWHRAEPTIRFAWHVHAEHELTLIVRSQGRRFVGDSIEPYESGDLVLLGPGVPHSYESDGSEPHEQLVVHFSSGVLGGGLADPQLHAVARLFGDASRGVCFRGKARAEATRLIERVPALPPLRGLATFFEALHVLATAATGDQRTLSAARFGANAPNPGDAVVRALAHIDRHFTRKLPMAEVAQAAGVSVSALARQLRRSTGTTFVAYVNELRLRRACQLLLETDEGLARVAELAGFPSVSYFCRRFLRERGLRPTDYRRRGRSSRERLLV